MRITLLACLLCASCALTPSAKEDAALRPVALLDAYLIAHGMAASYASSPDANPDVVLTLARLDIKAQLAVRRQDGATDAIAALTDYAARQSAAFAPAAATP